ncbi:MAG: hypothetical protein KY475_05670 [Planctomycetes bacterium]|nr:hypothetical protein [Planctomycetota bacterium]
MATQLQDGIEWQTQPEAAAVVGEIREAFLARCPRAVEFQMQLLQLTGTRLADWVDHVALPEDAPQAKRLAEVGFVADADEEGRAWRHPGGMFPAILSHREPAWRMAIHVESVVDFLSAYRLDDRVEIHGLPLAPLRKARAFSEGGGEFWVVERHGYAGFEPPEFTTREAEAVLAHGESFRLRRRDFDCDEDGFEHAMQLIRAASAEVGVDRACDLFFAAEREYWMRRNHAARVQKARQDQLGLGWGNHDHHTYRASREHFGRLIAALEALGMECRERFYAGREAGWGAQVLEQPRAGIVVFADVDLAPEEVMGDFAHEPLPPRKELGTVGLWCKLHGEAFLQAGMHHLECQFDFEAARHQLSQSGVPSMKPFTDFDFLRQAFTQGEQWPVDPRRLERAVAEGYISQEQAEKFRREGALGSHLEILQRDDGYKGFNQTGVSEIIQRTDPRKA